MGKRIWSFGAGFLLVSVCVVIGLWANLTLYDDALAAAEVTGTLVDSTTVLLTTLFIGLSGGHYIGGSFKKDSQGRWFALGANTVLWLVFLGFIALQVTSGGEIVRPLIFGATLFLIGGGIFALHKSGLVEDQSRLDEYIGHFSSKGTGIVVAASFIIRTLPDPTLGAIGILVVGGLGILFWKAYEEHVREIAQTLKELMQDLTSSEKS